MPEYDAFGREIGEDTLAGLGGSSAARDEDLIRERTEAQAQPAPPRETEAPIFEAPVAKPDPAAPQQPVFVSVKERPVFVSAPAFRKPKRIVRRAGLGCLALIILIPVLLVALGAALAVFGIDTDPEVKTGRVQVPRPSESLEIAPGKKAKPPRGLESRSLVRRANFARAMKRLRAANLGSVSFLRVAPERIDARLVTQSGRLSNVQLTFDGKLNRGGSTAGFKSAARDSFAQINTAAPERLTRAGARRLGRKTTSINYTAYLAGGGQFVWGAYFKGSGIAQGDARGRFLRRIN